MSFTQVSVHSIKLALSVYKHLFFRNRLVKCVNNVLSPVPKATFVAQFVTCTSTGQKVPSSASHHIKLCTLTDELLFVGLSRAEVLMPSVHVHKITAAK